MKNVLLGVNVLLVIAVAGLYALYFSGKPTTTSAGEENISRGTKNGVAYFNMDSLLDNYIQARELNEAFMKKREAERTELNYKVKMWTRAGEEFQRKVDNNGFLTRERANQEYAELVAQKENLEKLEKEMHDVTLREQVELNRKLYDVIISFLTEYNKEKEYSMILSTTLGGNVFYAEPGLDITRDVVDRLNARHAGKQE
ncbi:MAG: OmpH family outer membrane protein [Odoribacteraceae bacterium]|jgi:outer membrane protein|nr:OmpH family outer membrane protein [Odoribacteraceae bacterium]